MPIYRCGPIAWVWRILGGAALATGLFLLSLALRFGEWTFVAMAVPLLVPVVALG